MEPNYKQLRRVTLRILIKSTEDLKQSYEEELMELEE